MARPIFTAAVTIVSTALGLCVTWAAGCSSQSGGSAAAATCTPQPGAYTRTGDWKCTPANANNDCEIYACHCNQPGIIPACYSCTSGCCGTKPDVCAYCCKNNGGWQESKDAAAE